MDLVSQKRLTKELGHTDVSTIDHGPDERAIILVNERGHYLGDWRSSDTEAVRHLIILLKSCLHWFEKNLHGQLISLFAKEKFIHKRSFRFQSSIFDVQIKDSEPALDFNENQLNNLNDFFIKVFGLKNGLEGTYRDLNDALTSCPSMACKTSKKKLKDSLPAIYSINMIF